MSRFQYAHDNVLTSEERAKSAQKCITLLNGSDAQPRTQWSQRDIEFFVKQERYAVGYTYAPVMATVDWLRDMVGKYCY